MRAIQIMASQYDEIQVETYKVVHKVLSELDVLTSKAEGHTIFIGEYEDTQ